MSLDCLGIPCWEISDILPSPQAIGFGIFGIIHSTPGEPLQWASLTVTPREAYPDGVNFPTGFHVWDPVGNPWDVKGGGTISIVPEPEALAMLIVGTGLVSHRRRQGG